MPADTRCYLEGVERTKRALLLEINSNLNAPAKERSEALVQIERACVTLRAAVVRQMDNGRKAA